MNERAKALIGRKVRMINIDSLWCKERYNANGEGHEPCVSIKNGDIGILKETSKFFNGLYIEFENGDISQTYLFTVPPIYSTDMRYENLLDAVEPLETPRTDRIYDTSEIKPLKTLSKVEMARLLHDKEVVLTFVEEGDYNLLGFKHNDVMYVFEENIE